MLAKATAGPRPCSVFGRGAGPHHRVERGHGLAHRQQWQADPARLQGGRAVPAAGVRVPLAGRAGGNDDRKRLAWMNSHNDALGGKPLVLVQSVEGLVATLNYPDGMRAFI